MRAYQFEDDTVIAVDAINAIHPEAIVGTFKIVMTDGHEILIGPEHYEQICQLMGVRQAQKKRTATKARDAKRAGRNRGSAAPK